MQSRQSLRRALLATALEAPPRPGRAVSLATASIVTALVGALALLMT